MKSKIVMCIVVILLGITSIYSEYADLTFIIDSQGNVLTSGIDSSKEFILNSQTPEFTSKKGKIWTINITTHSIYETFIFESIFPKGTQISYIKTTPNFRIDEIEGKLSIIGTGKNKPITFIVQYEINEDTTSTYFNNPIIIGIIGIFFGLLVSFLFTKMYKRKKETVAIKKEISEINDRTIAAKVDVSILPERQKEIITILKIKHKITQKELEEIMKIPKASISRNVKTLEIKGVLKKEQVGNTNYISLH